MRILLSLLLLTTATPVVAQTVAEEEVVDRPVRSDPPPPVQRSQRAEPRAERPTRPSLFERVIRAERQERAASPAVVDAPEPVQRERWSAPAPERAEALPERRGRPVSEDGTGRIGDSVREWRWRERNAERERRQASEIPAPPLGERLARPESVAPPTSVAPPARADERIGRTLRNRIATEGWRREWRQDRRFDWRRHRYGYRDRFDVGIYVDPFGWNYRRWNVGWRLPRHHYARHFWLHDPWQYRLPPVYGPYRWVRYWDDALLIDLRSGRVVDVIHDFFW